MKFNPRIENEDYNGMHESGWGMAILIAHAIRQNESSWIVHTHFIYIYIYISKNIVSHFACLKCYKNGTIVFSVYFATSSFRPTFCFWYSSMLIHIHAFSMLRNNIPVCEFITVYLSILLSMDIWIVFKLFVLSLFAVTANIALIIF